MAKETTTKPSAAKTARKPKAAVHKKKPEEAKHAEKAETQAQEAKEAKARHLPKGRYVFATGRRKTAVANVRMFAGQGESMVNRKPYAKYFSYDFYRFSVERPFDLTGLGKDYHFEAHISGGGPNAQAEALRHGIAVALSKISEEVKKVLKKNGLLTRDDRRKERKKPGLKRARRSPQWAKR